MGSALLEQLKDMHADSFGWALACCGWEREVAEDVLQESYLQVLDGRARFGDRSSLKTWFFAVIKQVAAQAQRAGRRRAVLGLRLFTLGGADDVVQSGTVERDVYRDQANRQMMAALMSLSQRQREIVHLVFYGGLTLEQAAETIGLSLGSARTHYHRGKARLTEVLHIEATHD